MTRMVPPRVHPKTPSSERRVFKLLEGAPGTEDWWALHSLALSRRRSGPFGEADFVLGIPGKGLLVLEVKGGRILVEEGVWSSVSKDGTRHRLGRSPLVQARDAAFAIVDAIRGQFGGNSDPGQVVVGSVAVFTDSISPPDQPSFERWEVLDYHDLKGGQTAGRLLGAIAKTVEKVPGKARTANATPRVLSQILEFLRPDFDGAIPRAAHIRESEDRIFRLTRQQFGVLDMLEDNSRTLVRGGAGTGKTVLALEAARRSSSRGERTLLLCFNKPLAESLERTLTLEGGPKVDIATCHSFLRSKIVVSSQVEEFRRMEAELLRTGDSSEVFSVVYPLFGGLAALESDLRYDHLVLDEGQDLIRPDLLSALGEWLDGGLREGRWTIFGDFDNQAIYAGNEAETKSDLASLLSECAPARVRLSKNFRNSPAIGEELTMLCGFEDAPFELADADADLLPVNYLEWENQEQQSEVVRKEIRALLDSGVRHEDIVLLSPNRFARSVASRLVDLPVAELESPWPAEGQIGFSTVHRFKGLESPVVILCDLESIIDSRSRSLLYVGMSRAKSYLALAVSPSARKEARQRFRDQLQQMRKDR